jgi:hypothetical protein
MSMNNSGGPKLRHRPSSYGSPDLDTDLTDLNGFTRIYGTAYLWWFLKTKRKGVVAYIRVNPFQSVKSVSKSGLP